VNLRQNDEMGRFAELSLTAFLDALASPEPTPGGGTASAVAGAVGASLLMMVSTLPKSRLNTDAERIALREAGAALASVKDTFVALADTDADAYKQVLAAYRLPKSSDTEKTARTAAVQRALRAATEAPVETLRAAASALRHARAVAEHANRNAVSDVRVALELLEASAAGGAANVEINLPGLDDDALKQAMAADVLTLTNQLKEDAAAARAALS
jgi:formiminotetrahydrofolate cyclodeaminase